MKKIRLENSIEISHGSGGIHFFVEELENEQVNIPQLVIDITANTNLVNKIEIKMTPERLKKLGAFLIECGEKCESNYKNPDSTPWGGIVNSKFYKRDSKGNQID